VIASTAAVVAIALPTGTAAPRATDCGAFRKTASPTHSRLWTVDQHGTWAAAPSFTNPDGSMWLKAPWFAAGPAGRASRGPHGTLTITGRRLDAEAPPLRAEARQVGVAGFGGSGVWAVVLTFPSEGCWAVTGRVERTTHTFRLLVSRDS
jgi:hypothetical protein